VPGLQFTGFAVSDGWAKANADTLVRFLRATLRGLTWLREPANKDEAKQIYRRFAEIPPEIMDTLYDQMVVENMLGTNMRPNLDGTEKVLSLAVQQGAIPMVPPLDTWIDLSYLDQASRPAR